MKSDRKILSDICSFVSAKIFIEQLGLKDYVSTENMIANKGGITTSSCLPSVPQTQAYSKGDVLISNIRPYFKKIWLADRKGGCSNDVLVFRAKVNVNSEYLYYVLSNDDFFSYSTLTSKGTKMPRGDKKAIMQYLVPDFDLLTQKCISKILRSIDRKIELNNKINDNLQAEPA